MMNIENYRGNLVCKGDPSTGLIESSYKHSRESTYLPVGGIFTIERNGIRTIITRIADTSKFLISSYDIVP